MRATRVETTLHASVYEEEESLWAEVRELPRCFAHGETIDDLKQNLTEAVGYWLRESSPAAHVTVDARLRAVALEEDRDWVLREDRHELVYR